MKPSFALNITDTSIGLLHRTARGWLQVGETAFDTEDLGDALGYLRGSALGLSPGGLTTKLVIPNSQIKYLELDAPGPGDTDRRNQIRAALVGRTPYNVEDLVFDWSGTGAKVQVAVVARETLDEAEAFAAEHRFNPVSFVGAPLKGDFKGEPWFGPTKLSATLLEKGEKVDRDQDPVQVTARDLPKSHPGAAKTADDSSSEKSETAAKDMAEKDKPTRAQRRAAAAAAAAAPVAKAGDAAKVDDAAKVEADKPAAPEPELAPAVDVPAVDVPVVDVPVVDVPVVDAFPESAEEVAAPAETMPEPAAEPVTEAKVDAEPAATEVASASVTDNQAFPEVAPAPAGSDDKPASKEDLPPAPSAAMMAAFASRRASDLPNPKRFGAALLDPNQNRSAGYGSSDLADRLGGKSTPPPLSRPKVAPDLPPIVTPYQGEATSSALESAAAKPSGAFVTAPSIPGSRKRKPLPVGADAAGLPDGRKPLTKPGGTFASKERGKPRYLGLILTGLLLLFLALIAAWSSFVLGSNDAPSDGTAVVSAPDVVVPPAEVPAVDDEMLADSQDPADFAAGEVAAADAGVDPAANLTTEVAPESAEPDAAIAEAEPPVAAPEPAPAEPPVAAAKPVAEPPVATEPPVAAAVEPAPLEPAPVDVATTESPNPAPLSEAQDEIFLAETDEPPLALDPLALPQPIASNDALLLPQLEPPPFGTVYQFDADGRIRPTPEGIITPEGVRLLAGKPSLLPPPRPDALIAAAAPATAEPAAEGAASVLPETAAVAPPDAPFPSDPALAEARPRPRPAGLAPASKQADDDAALVEPGSTQVTSLRPLPRPTTVLAAGEAARQSTASASLAGQAEQTAAVEAAVQASFQPDANTSPLAVAVSRKPAPRPKDMSRAVEAAVAAAVGAPEPQVEEAQPEADAEPEVASAAPAIPTRASVAKQATYVNAINLSKINLIGVYGTKSNRYALVRQANGRYKKVQVGDSIDGGRVAAIGNNELRYQKSGRMVSLKMPRT
jgi:hypothetical protein